jgi:hypothetical protein
MGIPKSLTKNTFDKLGGWVNWSNQPISLGDIVTVKHGVMERIGSISLPEFGIKFAAKPSDGFNDLTVLAEDGTAIDFSIGATVLPGGIVPEGVSGALTVALTFEKENAFCFKSKEWAFEVIDNQIALDSAIKALHHAHKWKHEYNVVVGAVRTSSYCLAASTEKKGNAKLQGSGKLAVGKVVDIGDASLNLSVTGKSLSVIVNIGSGDKAHPTTVLARLRRLSIFDKPTGRPASTTAGSSTPAPAPKETIEVKNFGPDDDLEM